MSEAEEKFKRVVWQAIWDAVDLINPNLIEPLVYADVDSFTDAVVGSLKLDDWFISRRGIHEIQEYDWRDTNFDADEYVVYTNILEEDDE